MKKIVLGLVTLMVMAFSSMGIAEVKKGAFSITPSFGGYLFEGNEDLKHSPVYGLRAGYNWTKNLTLEGYVHYLKTEMKEVPGNPDMKVYGFGIEELWHFMPEKRLVPFLAFGIGDTRGGLGS